MLFLTYFDGDIPTLTMTFWHRNCIALRLMLSLTCTLLYSDIYKDYPWLIMKKLLKWLALPPCWYPVYKHGGYADLYGLCSQQRSGMAGLTCWPRHKCRSRSCESQQCATWIKQESNSDRYTDALTYRSIARRHQQNMAQVRGMLRSKTKIEHGAAKQALLPRGST